jgi:hypothetical protein
MGALWAKRWNVVVYAIRLPANAVPERAIEDLCSGPRLLSSVRGRRKWVHIGNPG